MRSLLLLGLCCGGAYADADPSLVAYAVRGRPPVVRRGVGRPAGELQMGQAAAAAVAVGGAEQAWERSVDEMNKRARAGKVHLPVRSSCAGAALVVALVILIQTASSHASLHPALAGLLEQLAVGRLQWPLLVSGGSAFFMYAASDMLSQSLQQQRGCSRGTYDLHRMGRSGLVSSLLSGVLAVFYFGWLERMFPSPDATLASGHGCLALLLPAFAKMAVDVLLYEPLYDTVYISLQALLRGEPPSAALEELRKVPKVWCMAPRYWCLVDLVNFSCVSLRLRPLYNAVFAIPWSMYLTTIANDAPTIADDA